MSDLKKMIENLNAAVVACDANFNIIYANEKCKQVFKVTSNVENFFGNHMADCHKPETMDKLKKLFEDYKEKNKNLDYYTVDLPNGKLTIVNVPFYEGDIFAGVVEFIFEESLA